MTITQTFQKCLLYGSTEFDMENVAVTDFQGETGENAKSVSFNSFYELVSKFESFLIDRGVKKGSHILLCGKNSIELVAMIIASWRLAAICIPIDYRMTALEIANVATRVGADLIFLTPHVSAKEVEEKLDKGKEKLYLLTEVEQLDLKPAKREVSEVEDFEALVILTSGTTGMPKGAVHTYHSLVKNLMELAQLVNIDSTKTILLPLPVSHIFGLEVHLIALLNGAASVFCELDPKSFIYSINESKPNIIAGVPTIYGALLSQGREVVNLDNAEVLLSGGAPLPIPMAKQFEKEFSKRLNNGYGSTESKIICLNIDGPLESVGKTIPSVEIRIVGDEGELKEEGQEGQIFIKSDLIMKEYLSQPEKTKDAITENGYRTGDIGFVKDEHLFISGRAKEMIIVAGNKVFPIEVEQVLEKHSLVKEVAVTGQDHKRLGQIVKATIVIGDDKLSHDLDSGDEEIEKSARDSILKDLKDYSKENLKRELRPMVWNLRAKNNPLPKTRSGKIDKKVL